MKEGCKVDRFTDLMVKGKTCLDMLVIDLYTITWTVQCKTELQILKEPNSVTTEMKENRYQ